MSTTTTFVPLKWVTVINGRKKVATTHFGTIYTIEKIESLGGWIAKVTVPSHRGMYFGGTDMLIFGGVSYARARKAAQDDYEANGGR
jgi:hypothetical protein